MRYEDSDTAKAVNVITACGALAHQLEQEGDAKNAALFRELAACDMKALAGLYRALEIKFNAPRRITIEEAYRLQQGHLLPDGGRDRRNELPPGFTVTPNAHGFGVYEGQGYRRTEKTEDDARVLAWKLHDER
jgi:hypothetical protein